MMLSTPSVTLGSWAGHDDNSAMSQNSGFINNAKFTANLVNAINAADPNIFGPGQKFTDPNSDPNVTKSKVLVSTGEKPGKVNVKLSNDKIVVFRLRRYDDLFNTVKLFCEINSIKEDLIKPIIIKSLEALNNIYKIYNWKMSQDDINQLNSINNKNQL